MPIFPLSEEARRRRMLTPPINPDAPVRLPDIPAPTRTLPPPSRGVPGEMPDGPMMGANPGSSPLPESPSPRGMMLPSLGVPGGERYGIPGVRASRPPTRYDELAEMKGAYMSGTPGRGKSALTGLLEGLAGGGGLAGAATGAAYGAIDPRGLRESQFNRRERPQILERFAFEDADAERQRRQQAGELDTEYKRAQIRATDRSNLPDPLDTEYKRAQIDKLRQPPPLSRSPGPAWREVVGPNGKPILVDMNAPENKGKVFTPYIKPEKATGGGESGKNVVEIVDVSGQVLGRMPYHQVKFNEEGGVQGFPEGSRVRFPQPQGRQQAGPRREAAINPEFSLTEGLGAPVRAQAKRSRAESYKILRNGGYSDAEANRELDRLKIR